MIALGGMFKTPQSCDQQELVLPLGIRSPRWRTPIRAITILGFAAMCFAASCATIPKGDDRWGRPVHQGPYDNSGYGGNQGGGGGGG
jgi:hypothetical protein